jgi:translation initiation factor IF-2
VNIIHKGVGAITESDVLLASASDAIIVGFNVRPSGNARSLADNEEIDVRTYSIIYDAINDLRDAMEGMLSAEIKEEVTGNVEIREVYKITKVGNIAGCMVTSGKIFRNSKIRIIRDSVVIHSGELTSLKRFKDDAKEVAKGYDCGIQIKNFNNIEIGDVIEAYQEVEVKKKLK